MKPAPHREITQSHSVRDSFPSRAPERMEMKNRLPWIGQGTGAALISSVCCLLPAVAIAIGLTGGLAASLVSLGRFRLYGVLVGLGLAALASWLSLRRSRTCCTEQEYKRRQIAIPLTILASFSAVYALIMYLILPILYKLA